jgi:hypothetical protein
LPSSSPTTRVLSSQLREHDAHGTRGSWRSRTAIRDGSIRSASGARAFARSSFQAPIHDPASDRCCTARSRSALATGSIAGVKGQHPPVGRHLIGREDRNRTGHSRIASAARTQWNMPWTSQSGVRRESNPILREPHSRVRPLHYAHHERTCSAKDSNLRRSLIGRLHCRCANGT